MLVIKKSSVQYCKCRIIKSPPIKYTYYCKQNVIQNNSLVTVTAVTNQKLSGSYNNIVPRGHKTSAIDEKFSERISIWQGTENLEHWLVLEARKMPVIKSFIRGFVCLGSKKPTPILSLPWYEH